MSTPTSTSEPHTSSTAAVGGRAPHPAGPRTTSLGRLAGWCFDHRVKAVGLWLVVLVGIFVTAGSVGSRFSSSSDIPGSGSTAGLRVLEQHFPHLGSGGRSGTIVFRSDRGVDDPAVQAEMEELFELVDAGFPDADGTPQHPGATVVSPYVAEGRAQVARSGPLAGEVAYAQVNLAADVDDTESGLIGKAITDHAKGLEGIDVFAGGQQLAVIEPPETELIGVAFAILVLILAFGSVLAMGLPIGVALGGVAAGAGTTLILSNLFTIPDDATFLGLMIGLGVGIDYALFIVSRYREGLHEGRSPRAATVDAMESAGRAVVFAATTVMISMLGLLLVGIGWIGGMGIGVSATVLATMLTSTTLLPAMLGFARERVELTRWRGLIAAAFAAAALFGVGLGAGGVAAGGALLAVATLLASVFVRPLRRVVPRRRATPVSETYAYRWSRTIQRHPVRWAAAATVLLLVLAAPVLSLRLGWADEGNFAEETPTRQAYDLLAEGFGDGFNGPFVITVEPGTDGSTAQVERLRAALAETPGVAAVSPPVADDPTDPQAYLFQLVATTSPQDEATSALVRHLRGDVIPAAVDGSDLDVHVTGSAAIDIDITDYLAGRMVVFFGAVLAVSFLLLMTVFRSVLVPLKAVVMNLLSIGAAYGVVVAVFQWGWAGSLIGIEGGPINPFIPMMLFAIVFGLSMDYEVFMLSRIREEYLRTGDATTSVADGLASTARVITAAAAIMVVVFASFMLEDLREIKLFGLGLALAVVLDATLVRMVVVPATMELLGERNWWLPRWLDRLLPHLEIEPADRTVPQPPTEAAPARGAAAPQVGEAVDLVASGSGCAAGVGCGPPDFRRCRWR
ncbi:MAG TPA: MMPL family transporter [Aquihabitans sp.]|jgi:RND superfamily putative drug exporter|nr:MMPL family transporter [Aquihabitans sp.]